MLIMWYHSVRIGNHHQSYLSRKWLAPYSKPLGWLLWWFSFSCKTGVLLLYLSWLSQYLYLATFCFFIPLGFTINTLTMFGFVLAIGIVVDDAIIVVEAVQHYIDEQHMSPKEATYNAMKEISAPVIAIALILAAVFVPVGFIPGIVGRLYQQFAITIAISVIISAFTALSLTPALCTLLFRPSHHEKRSLD